MADQAQPQNIGNETLVEFCSRPEWSPNYTNPDGGDTFASLVNCINGVWGRAVRDYLKQNNEAWACRHDTPLLQKLNDISGGNDWRPSDDAAYVIDGADFGAAALLVPDYLFTFNLDNSNKIPGGLAEVIEQSDQTDSRAYSYVRMAGRPGTAHGTNVIGMRTFSKAVGFATFHPDISSAKDLVASITVRVPEWPQANLNIVLLAIKHRQIDAETGATDRLNFEFGLGPNNTAFAPGNLGQSYGLYVRWRDTNDLEQIAYNEQVDENAFSHGVGITPGYEWTLGFHRYTIGGGDWRIDFYVNGIFTHTFVDLNEPEPGTSTSIRFLVGAGSDGKQFAGGPIRNVILNLGAQDPTVVAPLMKFMYQKGAGYI